MVASTVELPNLRRMFLPDPGYIIIDADLQRADAQVVAWDADDEELKDIFRSGLNIHEENAKAIGCTYQQAKQGVHAVNYGVSARTLSTYIGGTTQQAQQFINSWLGTHPKIPIWQSRIKFDLETTRTIRNKFGFRRFFFDRLNPETLHQALAWIPQSTVALVTNQGLINIDSNLPEVQLLLQVHDSLVMQAPMETYPEILDKIIEQMEVPVPYDDPLTIPVTTAVSEISWGDIKPHRKMNGCWEMEVSEGTWKPAMLRGNSGTTMYQ